MDKMQLIIFIILELLHFSKEYKNCVYLEIGGTKTINTTDDCLFFDIWEFKDEDEIEVILTIYNGYFENSDLLIAVDNNLENEADINITNPITYEESDIGSYSHETLYSEYTYSYIIQKPGEKYLYVAVPKYIVTTDGYVEISVNKKFPVWAIILIVIGSVGFLIFITILIILGLKNHQV